MGNVKQVEVCEERNYSPTIRVNENNFLYHPIAFLNEEYGGDTDVILKKLSHIIGLGLTTGFIKNKTIKRIIRGLLFLITAFTVVSEFVLRVKRYFKNIEYEQEDAYTTRVKQYSKLLDIPESHPLYDDIPLSEFFFNRELVMWFCNGHRLSNIKILKWCDLETGEIIKDFKLKLEKGTYERRTVIFKMDGEKYLWDFLINTSIMGHINIDESYFSGLTFNYKVSEAFHTHLLHDFVKSINIKKNIIRFRDYRDIVVSPRRNIPETLNQFDVPRFISEITWVLSNGGKRTYAFVGKQGTGKSSVLRSVEASLTNYLIIHLCPEDFETPDKLKYRFEMAKVFQPVVIMIEDADACNLKEKDSVVGTFLECIDEVNKNMHMVIIYTVNDTSLIHPTIINRPGRSDRVIEIHSPKTVIEVYDVMMQRFNAIKNKYKDIIIFEGGDYTVLESVCQRCLNYKFTQAEITNAVVEQALIEYGLSRNGSTDRTVITSEDICSYLENAVDTHLETRQAIKNCNFNNQDPINYKNVNEPEIGMVEKW